MCTNRNRSERGALSPGGIGKPWNVCNFGASFFAPYTLSTPTLHEPGRSTLAEEVADCRLDVFAEIHQFVGDFTQRGHGGLVVAFDERLLPSRYLSGSFCRQYNQREAVGNLLKTIFNCNARHTGRILSLWIGVSTKDAPHVAARHWLAAGRR